jgi:hypothetical protein
MRTGTAVSTRIWLLGALSLGLGAGTALGVLAYEVKAANASYEYTLPDRPESDQHVDAARWVAVSVRQQVQEWKDAVFHGYHAVAVAKYSGQLRSVSSTLSEMGLDLQASATDPAVRQVTGEVVRAQSALRSRYEASLRGSTEAIAWSANGADQLLNGQDRAVTVMIGKVEHGLVQRAIAAFPIREDVLNGKSRMVCLAALAPFALIIAVAGFAMPKVSDTCRRDVGSSVSGRRKLREQLQLLDMLPTVVRLEFPDH